MEQTAARKLSRWYQKNARDLPWRRTSDPYALWLSEIMLQQTQVVTVIPYYEKFLQKFPRIQDLAKASLDQVLKNWEGLGYYSRARNLHKGAIILAKEGWPPSAKDWEKIPGVGASTASALASFIHGEASPVVDGNVQRVLCRFYQLDIPLPAVSKDLYTIRTLATNLIQTVPAADHNQAMMELGATICLPREPQCERCPWSGLCKAQQTGKQLEYPKTKPKMKRKTVPVSVGILAHQGKILITRRPQEGLLGGLSELPGGKIETGESAEQAVIREFLEETGLQVRVQETLQPIRHHYTHFSVILHPFVLEKIGGRLSAEAKQRQAQWVSHDQLKTLAFPAGTYKIFNQTDLKKIMGRSQNK